MTITPRQAALLRNVAEVIVSTGYATYPDRIQPRYTHAQTRGAAYYWLSRDVRIHSRARHTRTALIEETMQRYNVTRSNAKALIYRTRRMMNANPQR